MLLRIFFLFAVFALCLVALPEYYENGYSIPGKYVVYSYGELLFAWLEKNSLYLHNERFLQFSAKSTIFNTGMFTAAGITVATLYTAGLAAPLFASVLPSMYLTHRSYKKSKIYQAELYYIEKYLDEGYSFREISFLKELNFDIRSVDSQIRALYELELIIEDEDPEDAEYLRRRRLNIMRN